MGHKLDAAQLEIKKLEDKVKSLKDASDKYDWLCSVGGKVWKDPLGSSSNAKGVLYDIAVEHEMKKGR